MSSIERRLERFLANEQVEVNAVWETFLGQVLPYWKGQKLTFVLDCTPYNAQFTIVYVGLLVHSRVLPVAWVVMPQQEHWEERQWDIVARLLDRVCAFLPETDCTLLADRGLAGSPLVRLCEQRHWHYVLRICEKHPCRRQMGKQNKWSPWWSAEELSPEERSAVVWACTGLARGDHRDRCECLLARRVSGGLVDHFRPACWQNTHSHLCIAHAC